MPVAVQGADDRASADVEALVHLLGAVVERRSAAGWEVVDLLVEIERAGGEPTQREVARSLGVSEQAVSQRLRAALWSEERAARPLATRLLGELDAG